MVKYRFQYDEDFVQVAELFPRDLKDYELEELYSRHRAKH